MVFIERVQSTAVLDNHRRGSVFLFLLPLRFGLLEPGIKVCIFVVLVIGLLSSYDVVKSCGTV